MSDLDKADRLISGIFYNYPRWPSTFGPCVTTNCDHSARGGNLCANCYEKLLAELVEPQLAKFFHESVKETNRLWGVIANELEKKR